MLFFTGGGLTLFAYRARDLKQGGIFAPISREGGLVLNNVLLTTACATVLVGTLYPLALESITGEKISVGAPFFNMTFGPLMMPLLLAMPFGPFLAWKRGDLYAAAQRLAFAAVAALVAVAIGFARDAPGTVAGAVRHRHWRLGHGGRAVGDRLPRQGGPGAVGGSLATRRATCRAPPTARRWRTSASGSWSSASSPRAPTRASASW